MLLVILGAGASFDSVPHLPIGGERAVEQERPPLANRLFDNRPIFVSAMDRFPECKELVPFLRKSGVAVERELAKFQQQAQIFPRAHQELAAIRYYLHLALWDCQNAWRERHRGTNNYVSFVREIERWRYAADECVCFVTFNYDTMLEEAMLQVLGFQIRDLGGYIQEKYALIKLHGSINWGREIWNQSITSAPHTYNHVRLISEAASLQISDQYMLVNNHPMGREGSQQLHVFPAISIPVERKDEFNCPSAHVDKLKNLLPEVTRIMTIGWRGAEADFLKLLFDGVKNQPNLMIVSGNNGGCLETAQAFDLPVPDAVFRMPSINPQYITVASGFTGLLLEQVDQLHEFLRTGLRLVQAKS